MIGFWMITKYKLWWGWDKVNILWTHLFPMPPFSTTWKHEKTISFSVFRGQGKGALGTDELKGIFKNKNIKKINIKHGDTQIKLDLRSNAYNAYWMKQYLEKLWHLKLTKSILTPALRILLCNVLIQRRFHYACSASYSNLQRK